jgi:hypothetical protein
MGACKTPASIVKPGALYPSRGGQVATIGPEEVLQRCGIDPKQVPDFIALRVCLALPGLGRNVLRNWCGDTANLMASLTPVCS